MRNKELTPLELRIHTNINLRSIRERYGYFKGGMQADFKALFPATAKQVILFQIKALRDLKNGSYDN